MNQLIQEIIEKLQFGIEPDSGRNIVQLRMIRDIRLENEQFHFKIYLPSATYKHKDKLYAEIHEILTNSFPGLQLHAHFVNQLPMTDAPNTNFPNISNFIAVGSGKGGVGKSSISAFLAISLRAAGYKVGLLDADLYGPSIPTMFGIRDLKPKVVESEGKHKMLPIDVQGLSIISLGNIIDPEQAVVLRGPRLAAIIKQFFFDTLWPELDYLIIDLPPGTGDVQLTLVQTIPLTGVVMVTTPQEIAYIDAVKAANMFTMDQIKVPILGVIENMSWFEPDDNPGKKYFIFGQGAGQRLATKTESSLLGQIPIREGMRQSFDSGNAFQLDSFYSELFNPIIKKLKDKIDFRNLIYAPSQVVQAN